jgi:hypothetical protein
MFCGALPALHADRLTTTSKIKIIKSQRFSSRIDAAPSVVFHQYSTGAAFNLCFLRIPANN